MLHRQLSNTLQSMADKKVVVLGGSGFLGTYASMTLLSKGYRVLIVDQLPPKFSHPNMSHLQASVSDNESMSLALENAEIVLHLQSAILPSDGSELASPRIDEHLSSLNQLLENMQNKGVFKLMFFSSGGAIYGNPSQSPTPENHPLLPVNTYGASKKASEELIASFISRGLQPLVVRPANIYGYGQGHRHRNGLVNTLMYAALNNEQVRIYGLGDTVRDYLYVEDVMLFLEKALDCWIPETFNLGYGIGHTIHQVIDWVEEATQKSISKVYFPARKQDPQSIVLDCRKAALLMNWKAKMNLEQGISMFLSKIQSKNE